MPSATDGNLSLPVTSPARDSRLLKHKEAALPTALLV